MNRYPFTIRIIFGFLLTLSFASRTLAGMPSGAGHAVSAWDSLKRLDSLVNINKVSNNPIAIRYAKRALVIARCLRADSAMADAFKMMGIAYFPTEKDSSYYYFTRALKIADDARLLKRKVPLVYDLAMVYSAAFNYQSAITLLDSSIRLANLVRDREGISRAYIALGNINLSIHDIGNAKKMYESALVVARKDSLFHMIGVAMGNLAQEEFESNTPKSISLQRTALNYLTREKGTEEEMAFILINMGNRFTNPDSALFYYKSALDLALNAHLPKVLFGAYNNMAYSYLDKKDIAMAESCLKDHAIPAAIRINDHDWLSSLYDTYADVCIARKDYKLAVELQKKSLRERVRDNKQKASEQLRLLAALLDLKNKELTIRNEEKQLLLQKNRIQRTELGLALVLLIAILAVSLIYLKMQRNKVKFHKELIESARKLIEMEEKEKGRTARELHDLTGQLIMGISGSIENIDFPDPEIKEQIRSHIHELGVSIRQISHRMNRAMIEHFTFNELIRGLCEDYSKISGMRIDLHVESDIPDLPNELVLHFYRIIQELLTNAGKYALEDQVKLNICVSNDKLVLNYSDNGPGFVPDERKKNSMGLMNIYERAKLNNGQAKLTTEPGKGTRWEIIFPVKESMYNRQMNGHDQIICY